MNRSFSEGVPGRRVCCPIVFALLLLILATGCDVLAPPPTRRAPVEITAPTPPPTRRPSPTPRPIVSVTPSPTTTITPSLTPFVDYVTLTPSPPGAPPAETLDPTLLAQVIPDAADALPANTTLIGRSAGGRGILARRLGGGAMTLLLVGGIHGGWEANTVLLMNEALTHFAETPEDIAPGLSLVIVPALNPDGLLLGREEAGRFNDNGVDLNRNWACDWSSEAFWRDQTVDPGEQPFSEPETAALADYILLNPPVAVLFYHSAANGVFAGACDGDHGSQVLGHIYGRAALYPSDSRFNAYQVTGDASSWVDGQGIPSLTVELQSWTDSEWDRNYDGIMAVQCDLVRRLNDPAARRWAADRCVGGDG